MQPFKRILLFLFLIAVIVFGLVFATRNAAPVAVDYLLATRELPLAVVVIIALALGAVLGILASMGLVLRARRELHRLRRSVNLTRKEINNLRSLPLKDKQQ